jgi:peroxin-19
MKNLTNNSGGNGDEAMNQLGNLLNELMGGMGGMAGANQTASNPEEPGNDKDMMKKVFEDMMKNVNDGDFDSVAQNLLKEFMDKEILYEPLQEAKKNYDEYLKANTDKIKDEDMKNYKGQYECIEKLIKICDSDANNKEEMIKTFEQMHEFGMPPEGILNPLQKINPGLGGGPTNMNDPGCNIF